MRKNIFKYQLLVLFSFASLSLLPFYPCTATAETPPREQIIPFKASKVGKKIFTNIDVYNYLKLSRLSDQAMASIFLKADRNMEKYKSLIQQHLKPQFALGLRELSYFHLLELDAAREENQQYRFILKTDKGKLEKKIEEIESKMLGPFMDDSADIEQARELFGERLITMNYPHNSSFSVKDVYNKWLNHQRARLKEDMRITKIRKEELILATKGKNPQIVDPIKIWNFRKKTKEKINKLLNEKILDRLEVDKILTENPNMNILIKDVNFTSLNEVSMTNFKKNHRFFFDSYIKELKRNLPLLFEEQIIKKIDRYLLIADTFAKRYDDDFLLFKREEIALKKYHSSKRQSDFIKSKLYRLAALSKKLNSKVGPDFIIDLKDTISQIPKDLSTPNIYDRKDFKDFPIYTIAEKLLREKTPLKQNTSLTLVDEELFSLVIYILEQEMKKTKFLNKNKVTIDINSDGDYTTFKKIESIVQREYFSNELNRYRNHYLRAIYEGKIEFRLEDGSEYYGRSAFNFLLQQK